MSSREIVCALLLASLWNGLRGTASAQTPAERPAQALPWSAVVGQSGLRRLYSDSTVFVASPRGPLNVDRDVEYHRAFLQAELMARYGRAQLQFLPARVQLGWMSGVQYLKTRYEPEVDSRGQIVVEPFGNLERLGIARAGVFLGSNFGRRNNWNANIELMLDREFNTNMNNPIDDRNETYVRGGLAYVLKPGKRFQFDFRAFAACTDFAKETISRSSGSSTSNLRMATPDRVSLQAPRFLFL
jgi:hypothetical protein